MLANDVREHLLVDDLRWQDLRHNVPLQYLLVVCAKSMSHL
jgi:hypothetical protein